MRAQCLYRLARSTAKLHGRACRTRSAPVSFCTIAMDGDISEDFQVWELESVTAFPPRIATETIRIRQLHAGPSPTVTTRCRSTIATAPVC